MEDQITLQVGSLDEIKEISKLKSDFEMSSRKMTVSVQELYFELVSKYENQLLINHYLKNTIKEKDQVIKDLTKKERLTLAEQSKQQAEEQKLKKKTMADEEVFERFCKDTFIIGTMTDGPVTFKDARLLIKQYYRHKQKTYNIDTVLEKLIQKCPQRSGNELYGIRVIEDGEPELLANMP